eukprot:scaffold17337_cov71-Phaeocystis_antarctica.AAC.1
MLSAHNHHRWPLRRPPPPSRARRRPKAARCGGQLERGQGARVARRAGLRCLCVGARAGVQGVGVFSCSPSWGARGPARSALNAHDVGVVRAARSWAHARASVCERAFCVPDPQQLQQSPTTWSEVKAAWLADQAPTVRLVDGASAEHADAIAVEPSCRLDEHHARVDGRAGVGARQHSQPCRLVAIDPQLAP